MLSRIIFSIIELIISFHSRHHSSKQEDNIKKRIILGILLFAAVFCSADSIKNRPDLAYLQGGIWGEYDPYADEGSVNYIIMECYEESDGFGNLLPKYVLGVEIGGRAAVELGRGDLGFHNNSIIFDPVEQSVELPDFFNTISENPLKKWNKRNTGFGYENTSEFTYFEYIEINDLHIRLYNRKKPVTKGDTFSYKGIPVIVLEQSGRVREAVRIRDIPFVAGQPIDVSRFNETLQNNYPPGQTYLDVGERVFIMGRTTEKAQIGEWNNYWYMLSLTEKVFALYSDGAKVWAYAEFIDLE